jgi:hypothetical protein
MSLQDQIHVLFSEITNNQNRVNSVLDDNVDKIKSLLQDELNSEQMTIFLDWCNNKYPEFREQYMSPIGGFFVSSEFANPILDLVLDIENGND